MLEKYQIGPPSLRKILKRKKKLKKKPYLQQEKSIGRRPNSYSTDNPYTRLVTMNKKPSFFSFKIMGIS